MKLLVLSNMGRKPSAPLQGVFVDNQVNTLRRKGLDVSYHNMKFNGDSLWHKLFKYPVFFSAFIFKFLLSPTKFELIHVHYYYPTIILAWLYKKLRNPKVKIIVTCHGSDIYSYPQPSNLYKYFSNIVSHWIFTSAALEQKFFRKTINHTVMSAGFNDQLYCPRSSQKSIDVLFVGHLDKNKGVDRLIALAKSLKQVNFSIVGTGGWQLKLLEQNLTNVSLLGTLPPEELVKTYTQSKLLISLSRNESFGLVMTEAMACGVPCIATITDGSIEQLSKTMLIEQNDEVTLIATLEEKINQILSLPESDYKQLSQNVINSASKHSLSRITEKLAQLYTAK